MFGGKKYQILGFLVLNLIFVYVILIFILNLILILKFQNMFDDYGDEYVGEPTEDSRIADVTSTSIRRLATSTTSPSTTTTVTPGWVTRLGTVLNEMVSPAEDQTEAQGQRPGSYTQHDEAEQRLRIWQDVSISNLALCCLFSNLSSVISNFCVCIEVMKKKVLLKLLSMIKIICVLLIYKMRILSIFELLS
jgi:hypothetical protein